MNLQQASVISGLLCTIIVFLTTAIRQKRFDKNDLAAFIATFLSGYNIPASIFLCFYVFDPDPPELLSKAKIGGMDKYFSFSGIAFLFLSLMTIWAFIHAAYKRKEHVVQ